MVRRNDVSPEFDPARLAELEEQNAALQKLVEQREEQGGQLADLLMEARETIAALQNGDDGREQERRGRHGPGFKAWFGQRWSSPQSRLLALAAVMAARVALYFAYLHGWRERFWRFHPLPDEIFAGLEWAGFFAVVYLFVAWSRAQYKAQGLGQMFLKWMVFWPILVGGGMIADACRAHSLAVSFAVQLAAVVLTLSRLSELLADWLAAIFETPVARIRGWF